MIQLLIVVIATAIVVLAWYGIHCLVKLNKKLNAKKREKKKEQIRLHDEQVEKIKQRYLAEDKVVNLDEIEEEIRGQKFSLGQFFKGIINSIKNFFYTNKVLLKIYKVIKLIWHYFCYIFFPIKWIKSKTYDKLRYDQQKVFVSVLFLLPTIIGFILFFLYPLIQSFIYSFSTIRIYQGGIEILFGKAFTQEAISNKDYSTPDPSVKTIFFNYIYAFRENVDFPVKLWDTISSTVIDTIVITIFSLLIAVMLNGNFKGRGIIRAIFFLPVIFNSEAIAAAIESSSSLSTIAAAGGKSALSQLFDMKQFLIALKVPTFLVNFLNGITKAIYNTISYSGIQILIFLAAIQSVPKHLYEAAKIEGATKYESFWKITLPMVSPMIITVMVYSVVDSFLRSDINDIIDLQYKNSDYGKHAAMSWIYFGSSLLILALLVGITSRFVFYYDDKK